MIKHRIIDILKTFSVKDIKNFRDYLNSPFFNKSKKIVKVYEILLKFFPDFNSQLLTKELIYSKFESKKSFNKSTYYNMMADLFHHAENYLMYINFQKKEIKAKDFLLDELFKRNLDNLIESNLTKVKSLLRSNNQIDADYYFNTFKIITDELNHIHVNKAKSGKSIIDLYSNKLSDRGMYLTCLFVTEMMRVFDDLLALNKTFDIDKESSFIFGIFNEMDFEKLLKYMISNSKNKDLSVVFKIYYNLHMAFSDFENEKYYTNYKKLLFMNINIFSIDEIRFHLSRLIRYCKNKSSDVKLSRKYENELLMHYNYVLTKGYYKSSISNYLPVELFRIVLHLGLNLKKFKWTNEFINKFINEIHPDKRDSMYYLSSAEYYFSKKNFPKVLKNLHEIDLNHFMLKVDLRNILLMTYYELNEFESATSLIESYKHFLKYDKTLSKPEKKKAYDFIDILKILIKKKINSKNDQNNILEFELNEKLFYKNWVEEKILQLK